MKPRGLFRCTPSSFASSCPIQRSEDDSLNVVEFHILKSLPCDDPVIVQRECDFSTSCSYLTCLLYQKHSVAERIRPICQRSFGTLAISRARDVLLSRRTPTSTAISPTHRTLMRGRSKEGVLKIVCQRRFLYPRIARAEYISTFLDVVGYSMSGRREVPSFSRVWALSCLSFPG